MDTQLQFNNGVNEFYRSTERCTLRDDAIQCVAFDPVLKTDYTYPEMIGVPFDYCLK